MSPSKVPLLVGIWTHLIHGSLDPHESAPIGISVGSVVFAELTRVPGAHRQTQTHTQTTLRASSVAIGRIFVMHAVDAA